jgi:hypothetical protein
VSLVILGPVCMWRMQKLLEVVAHRWCSTCMLSACLCNNHVVGLQLWFTSVLRDGLATGASGSFAPFKDIGVYHLHQMLRKAGISGDHNQAVQMIMSGFDDATCMADVAPAFKQMHAKGIKVSQ